MKMNALSMSQYSYHADRFRGTPFSSLWVSAWGESYPAKAAPFSSCTTQLLEELRRQLGCNPGEVLVDLGCGTGGVGLWLAQNRVLRLIGIDRCSDATAIATGRAAEWNLTCTATFVVGDFCNTGFVTNAADAVLSVDAFTAAADIQHALSEVRRILKPNGFFVFTARQLSPASGHFRKMGSDWKQGLEQNGFTDVSIMTRPEVSELWRSVYYQWLENEADLRRELQSATVDALIGEARHGLPKMNEDRPWYLIKAIAKA